MKLVKTFASHNHIYFFSIYNDDQGEEYFTRGDVINSINSGSPYFSRISITPMSAVQKRFFEKCIECGYKIIKSHYVDPSGAVRVKP